MKHCPAINNGLALSFKTNANSVYACHCCLRDDEFKINPQENFWSDTGFEKLRRVGADDPGCKNCLALEESGISLRTGLLDKYGIEPTLSGPRKLDLLFDVSCNLACRTCGPQDSTFWQKHLKENSLPVVASTHNRRGQDVIHALQNIDLTNLREVSFAGGETLMGNSYWEIADYISQVADSKQITINFQSNGTQPLNQKHHSIVEKFKLIKICFSMDGINEKFEYLRWPAPWHATVNNINVIRDTAPSNVMFLIEETISIFNLYYINQSKTYHEKNFATNREGDITHYSTHLASGVFALDALTQEYVDHLEPWQRALVPNFKENPQRIQEAVAEIKRFDSIRNQSFDACFPEVAEFYARYL